MKRTRKILTIVVCASLMILIGTYTFAAMYTFSPSDPDLDDLDHYKYYSWGIDWSVPLGEVITAASLFFDNIRNWDSGDNDLYVHLLDTVLEGVTVGTDNQGGGDYFSGQGVLLNHWEDLSSTPQDITYNFDLSEKNALSSYPSICLVLEPRRLPESSLRLYLLQNSLLPGWPVP